MCVCNSEIRTPYCGEGACVWEEPVSSSPANTSIPSDQVLIEKLLDILAANTDAINLMRAEIAELRKDVASAHPMTRLFRGQGIVSSPMPHFDINGHKFDPLAVQVNDSNSNHPSMNDLLKDIQGMAMRRRGEK